MQLIDIPYTRLPGRYKQVVDKYVILFILCCKELMTCDEDVHAILNVLT